jgi:DNA-binding transcriptional LysR family regulator
MLTIDPGLMVPLAPVGELRKNTIVLRGNLPFTQLQAFEAVVRLGSFKAARTELGGSNVSRHVADLEDRLGRKLLLRSPRGALTPEGQLLFGYLTRSFEQIRRLMGAIEAGSFEPESIHVLLHEALFAPGSPHSDQTRP